jgi:hypothetical protein
MASGQNAIDGIQQFLEFSNIKFHESLVKLHRRSKIVADTPRKAHG